MPSLRPRLLLPLLVLTLSACAESTMEPPVVDTLDVPGEFATIADALLAAQPSEIIEVAPGTYPVNLVFGGKAVTLRSRDGVGSVILDGSTADPNDEVGSVLVFRDNEGLGTVIEGFILRGGLGTRIVEGGDTLRVGGAVFCDDSQPILSDCTLDGANLSAPSRGGGIACRGDATPVLRGCLIQDNVAEEGGAAAAWDGSLLDLSAVTMRRNDGVRGGALWCSDADPALTDCQIDDNEATAQGGGVYAEGISLPRFTNSQFQGNAAGSEGGAGFFTRADPVLTVCVLEANRARDGSALYFTDGAVAELITECTFEANQVDPAGSGGGALTFAGAGGEVFACLFSGNVGADGRGSAIDATGVGEPFISNCTVFGDESRGSSGAAVYSGAGATPQVLSSIVVFQVNGSAAAGTGALWCCNDTFGNEFGDDLPGTDDGANFQLDPLFCNPAAGELALQPGSPCRPGNHPGTGVCESDGLPCGFIGAFETDCP